MKREANFQTKWNHWGKNVYKRNLFFELKQTTTNSLPFSEVKPHQIEGLLNVRHGVVAYKMVDCGYQNFCDGFFAVEQPAVIGIKYPTGVAIIPIDTFVLESKRSKRRSLTYKRAMELSTIVFHR